MDYKVVEGLWLDFKSLGKKIYCIVFKGGGDELVSIYGLPGNVNIYTGEITEIGDEYFEHNINTFPGLSGSIVFLLDQDQPLCLAERDYEKAIGVHAGYKSGLGKNIAFKLVRKSLWQKCFGLLRSIKCSRS